MEDRSQARRDRLYSGISRKKYYWIYVRDRETGKPFLIYGGITESEATQKALETLSGENWAIKALPTRDLGSASAMIRGKKLESGAGLRESSRRLGHEKSLLRRNRRRRSL